MHHGIYERPLTQHINYSTIDLYISYKCPVFQCQGNMKTTCVKIFLSLFCPAIYFFLTYPEPGLIIQFDSSGPRHHFWAEHDNQDCHNLSTRFAVSGSLPLLALASYPGSGNTWVRYMVEVTSGVFTAAIREVWIGWLIFKTC